MNIQELPAETLKKLSYNVFRGPFEEVVKVIEDNSLDLNSRLDENRGSTMLGKCLHGLKYGTDNLRLITYLLENGANPNLRDYDKTSAFHWAIYEGDLDIVELFMQYEVEVNLQDDRGYTALFIFYREKYGNLAQEGVNLKKRCLTILEEMLKKGADPDIVSAYGTTMRGWHCVERLSVYHLLKKYDALNIQKSAPAPQEQSPSGLKYPEVCKEIWQNLVPKSGEADSVQGELLRAIEKLRDEAQRNGNGNYNTMHKNLALYIQDRLIESGLFDEKEIKTDMKPLTFKTKPYLEDDIYDRFCDRIAEFYLKFPMPISRT